MNVRKINLTLVAIVLTIFCFAQSKLAPEKSTAQTQKSLADSLFYPFKFISLSEAEKIIGHPAHLKDSLRKFTEGYFRLQFTYRSNVKDSIKNTFGSLFFGFEQYPQTSGATRAFSLIKAENEKSNTLTMMNQLGDEGFLINDQFNNPFIMIRKGNRIYKLRLVNVEGKTSANDLQLLAKKIVSAY